MTRTKFITVGSLLAMVLLIAGLASYLSREQPQVTLSRGLEVDAANAHANDNPPQNKSTVLADVSQAPREALIDESAKGPSEVNDASSNNSAPFDLGVYRLQMMKRLKQRVDSAKKGSEEESDAAYRLLTQAMFAHEDFAGGYIDGHGLPIRTQAADNINEFKTFSDGRLYEWTREQYPDLAVLTSLRLNKLGSQTMHPPSFEPQWPPLTDAQREAVDVWYAQACAELEPHPK